MHRDQFLSAALPDGGNQPPLVDKIRRAVLQRGLVITHVDSVRHGRNGDAAERRSATEAVIARVQHGGVCFVAGAEWHGDWVMRLSVTSGATQSSDIELSAAAIIGAWRTQQLER